VWNETQTVLLLSQPYPQDHYRVLDILKGKIVTIQPDSATLEIIQSTLVSYPAGGSLNHTAISYNFIEVAEIDTVKQTDCEVSVILEQEANATIQLNRYNNSTTPFSLTHMSGLAANEDAVGRYLEISLSENLQNQTSDIISETYLKLYYRLSDLDLNGDGDTDDPKDLMEDTLTLYLFDEPSQTWIKLSKDLDWVLDIGVNTTDIELYGESYAGYIWASLNHFSLYGLAALPNNRPPDISDAYPSPEYLWPPNHKFVDVTIEGVSDPDGDEITITMLNITSNEPPNSHEPDYYGVGTDTASLRSERLGSGDGRVYTITFLASDGRGGEAVGTVYVYVPHDQSGKDCGDDDSQSCDDDDGHVCDDKNEKRNGDKKTDDDNGQGCDCGQTDGEDKQTGNGNQTADDEQTQGSQECDDDDKKADDNGKSSNGGQNHDDVNDKQAVGNKQSDDEDELNGEESSGDDEQTCDDESEQSVDVEDEQTDVDDEPTGDDEQPSIIYGQDDNSKGNSNNNPSNNKKDQTTVDETTSDENNGNGNSNSAKDKENKSK
jgi:hypothetical protein